LTTSLPHIAIFAFNRPKHLSECLSSLEKCTGFQNYEGTIFIEGARNEFEKSLVEECYVVADNFANEHHFNVIKRQSNLGLARSIRSGIDQIFESSSSIIVIEDDLVLHSGFLEFVSSGLAKYVNEKKVASISGYQYPIHRTPTSPVFLLGADCWGWGTWSDRWNDTNFDAPSLIHEIRERNLVHQFNLDGTNNYTGMLEQLVNGDIDSWAVPWHASMYLQNRLTLYPPTSFVSNEGGDGSGTHFGISNTYSQELRVTVTTAFPDHIAESNLFREDLCKFYIDNRVKFSIFARVKNKIIRILNQ
jgi:hypothetical protein